MRTQNALGWISIIWFTSVVSISVSQDVKLQVKHQVEATCGTNLTLTCEASSSRKLDIKLFSWVRTQNKCQYGNDQPEPGVLCESSTETGHHRLNLTLLNVMPANEGKYLCKLRSNLGVDDASTSVTVRGCINRIGFFINQTHAECWFTGVYPSGVVHWFQGDINLTDFARTWAEVDQQGLFKVMSDLNVDKGSMSLPYNCSLWIPSDGKYLKSQQLPSVREAKSSGSSVTLQWICVMVWLLTAFGKV
ncbi:uncharacterized protein [Paralichthys olivaceus]|uniref:uncharacterized protein n=1 Tax=Paralichthys olivaceus TaxID=8255 RepID=UPI003752A7A3